MKFSSTMKYIASSLFQSFNPLKWSLSMQIAAVSGLFLSLPKYTEGVQELTSFQDILANETDENASYTFRCLSDDPKLFEKAGSHLKSCIHHLEDVESRIMPASHAPQELHHLHHQVGNFLRQFVGNATILTVDQISNDCNYFIVWRVGDEFINNFKTSLIKMCNYLIKVNGEWSKQFINIPENSTALIDNSTGVLQTDKISIWDAFSKTTHCLGMTDVCEVEAMQLFHTKFSV